MKTEWKAHKIGKKKKKEQKKTYWDNYFSYLTDIILLYASYISYNMIESATLTKM